MMKKIFFQLIFDAEQLLSALLNLKNLQFPR